MRKIIIVFIMILSSFALLGFSNENTKKMDYESDYKIKVNASIDEDFDEDSLIVVLNREESKRMLDYSTNDFKKIDLLEVSDLTENTKNIHKMIINKDYSFLKKENDIRKRLETDEFYQILLLTLRDSGKKNVLDTMKLLEKDDRVLIASPNFRIKANSIPNDYISSGTYENWWYEKISMPDAWSISNDSEDVLIGIVDSGYKNGYIQDGNNIIYYSHSDFLNVENQGTNNEYVISNIFLEDRASTNYNNLFNRDFVDTVDPWNENTSHGTHVAGIIGAIGNNGMGVTGTCWRTKMVSLKVLDTFDRTDESYLISALDHATSKGIDLLNMSLGIYSQTALMPAIDNYPGLVVCSAGNDNKNLDMGVPHQYPSYFRLNNLITVGASTKYDTRHSDSNYGVTTVDLFAPGDSIYSTLPNNNYGFDTGTSMAAPMVTGVAALLINEHPSYSPFEIKSIIVNNVDKVESLAGMCSSNGRLNAYKALNNDVEPKTFTGDVNNDGLDDLIMVKNYISSGVRKYSFEVIKGKNVGCFESNPVVTFTSQNYDYNDDVLVGDFNNDNYVDILIHKKNNTHRQLMVFIGSSNSTFSSSTTYLNSIWNFEIPYKCIIADQNGDSYDDFIVLTSDSNGKRIFLVYSGTNSSPYLTDPTSYISSNKTYKDTDLLFKGKINADLKEDLIIHTSRYASGVILRTIDTYISNSTGLNSVDTLNSSWQYNTMDSPCSLFVSNVNGDAYDDFVTCYKDNTYKYAFTYLGKNTSHYFTEPTNNSLTSTDPYFIKFPILMGDINGDSNGDLVSMSIDNTNKIIMKLFTGKNDGTFNTISYLFSLYYMPLTVPTSYYIMDCNGDNYDDFVIKRKMGNYVQLYVFKGSINGFTECQMINTTSLYN